MTPLKIVETSPGKLSLLLDVGSTKVEAAIAEHGHEGNGYFWEGIAQLLVATEAHALEGRFAYDPEASMFCAYGTDRAALEELGALMADVANRPDRLAELMRKAEETEFEFDD